MILPFIQPDWPAPQHVHAFCTTRTGGISSAPYDSFNLANHVDDNPQHVEQNRQILVQSAQLPESPRWLTQHHSTDVVNSLDLFLVHLSGSFVAVNLSDFEDEDGESSTETSDLSKTEWSLLFTVDVCVLDSKNVNELVWVLQYQ